MRRSALLTLLSASVLGCALDETGLGSDASPSDVLVDTSLLDAPIDDGLSEASDVADAPLDAGFTPSAITGLALWMRADMGVTLDGNNHVQTWADLSAFHATATQPSAGQRPTYGNQLNGHPVVTFAAMTMSFLVLSALPPLAAAHVFVINELRNSPASGFYTSGFWTLTGNAGFGACIPYTNGYVYDDFGSLTRHTTPSPLTVNMAFPNVYEVVSTANKWSASVNGGVVVSTGTNTVSFAETPLLFGLDNPDNYLDGDWAEIIMYDHELSSGDRALLVDYVKGRYNVVVN